MAKFELSIKTTYLPAWGVWQGCRELVQNARDAEVEFGAPMTVTHSGQTLRIENEGAVLPREALLFGHTTKENRGDLIGKFGEGLKLGILALVRAGRPVKVRSGSEVWMPTIARSERYSADVLVFDITGGREDRKRVRIEVGGVTESEWDELKGRFLFLNKPRAKNNDVVNTSYGDLLLAHDKIGKVFVKGIFVQNNPNLRFGYNFSQVEVDRDRKMVNSWDADSASSTIWKMAVGMRPDLFGGFQTMLEDGAEDIRGLSQWNVDGIDEVTINRAAEEFLKQFGENAFPVQNPTEAGEVAHLGKLGVIVKPQLGFVLGRKFGTVDMLRAKFETEIEKEYNHFELTGEEASNLGLALDLLAAATGKLEHPHVVDFRSGGMGGIYKAGEIFVSRGALCSVPACLAVLVHEAAHAQGIDGSKGHVSTIEKTWEKLVAHLLHP